jgi:hypothetical protein
MADTRVTSPEQVGDIPTQEEAVKAMSALDVLLGAKPVRQTDTWKITKRTGLAADLVLRLGSLSDRELKLLAEQSEVSTGTANRKSRRAGQDGKEQDTNLFLRLVVAKGVVEPDFNDPSVTSAHGVFSGDEVVQKVLLPGEIARVAELVMDLSGFNDAGVEYAGDL